MEYAVVSNAMAVPYFQLERPVNDFDDLEEREAALGGMLGCLVLDDTEIVDADPDLESDTTVAQYIVVEEKEHRETWEEFISQREEKAWRQRSESPTDIPTGVKLSQICGPSPARCRPPLHPSTQPIIPPPILTSFLDNNAPYPTPTSPFAFFDNVADPVPFDVDTDSSDPVRPKVASHKRKLSVVGPRRPSLSQVRQQRRSASADCAPYPTPSFVHDTDSTPLLARSFGDTTNEQFRRMDSDTYPSSQSDDDSDAGSYRGYTSSGSKGSMKKRGRVPKTNRSGQGNPENRHKFWCIRCETSFTRAHDLKRHNKRKHPELFNQPSSPVIAPHSPIISASYSREMPIRAQ